MDIFEILISMILAENYKLMKAEVSQDASEPRIDNIDNGRTVRWHGLDCS